MLTLSEKIVKDINLPETISDMVALGHKVSYIINLWQWLYPNYKWDAVVKKLIYELKFNKLNVVTLTVKKWLNTPQ